jgi:hypothetical protein
MTGRWWIAGMLLLMPFRLLAQPERDAEFEACTQHGINALYNLAFEDAERDFRKLVELRPAHPAGPFFLAMVQWWKILIDLDNEQYDDQFHESLDHVIDLCDDML